MPPHKGPPKSSPSAVIDEDSYIASFLRRGESLISSLDRASNDTPSTASTTYASYQDLVNARKKRNEEMLRSNGLLQAAQELKASGKKRSLATNPRGGKKSTPLRLRRSSRSAGRPIQCVPVEEIDSIERNVQRSIKKSRKEARAAASVTEFTEAQRAKLAQAEKVWIDQMHTFLLTVPHGRSFKTVSEDNARMVARQVRLLASGKGVTYRHWGEGVVFAQDRPIDLSANFDELYQEAQEFEDIHGRDLGNGWLLRHPIVKMQNYQHYLLSHKEFHDVINLKRR